MKMYRRNFLSDIFSGSPRQRTAGRRLKKRFERRKNGGKINKTSLGKSLSFENRDPFTFFFLVGERGSCIFGSNSLLTGGRKNTRNSLRVKKYAGELCT